MGGRMLRAFVGCAMILGPVFVAFGIPSTGMPPFLPGAIGPQTDAGAWYDDPEGRFRVLVPEGWLIRSDVRSLTLNPPMGNSGIAIWPETWCSDGTAPEAVAALEVILQRYSTNTQFHMESAAAPRMINGRGAADSLFTHYLAYGKAYQVLAILMAPDWSAGWLFSGLLHDASELHFWPDLNATLDSLTILTGMSASRFIHPSQHFELTVPANWMAEGNRTVGNERTDVILTESRGSAIVVVSEGRILRGTHQEARALLQDAIDSVSGEPGFQLLEAPSDRTVNGRPAAAAYLTWQPSTFNAFSDIAVVVDGDWDLAWAIASAGIEANGPGLRTCFNKTLDSFVVSDRYSGAAKFVLDNSPWINGIGFAAAAVESVILGLLILRDRRPRR